MRAWAGDGYDQALFLGLMLADSGPPPPTSAVSAREMGPVKGAGEFSVSSLSASQLMGGLLQKEHDDAPLQACSRHSPAT